jgi:hypothetical protein
VEELFGQFPHERSNEEFLELVVELLDVFEFNFGEEDEYFVVELVVGMDFVCVGDFVDEEGDQRGQLLQVLLTQFAFIRAVLNDDFHKIVTTFQNLKDIVFFMIGQFEDDQ